MKASRDVAVVVAIVATSLALFVYSQTRGRAVHSVTLNWSPTPGAVFYNVYRASASGGPYRKIGKAHSSLYIDTPVTSGSVFYYVVTAVEHGKESAYSNEIRAAVP